MYTGKEHNGTDNFREEEEKRKFSIDSGVMILEEVHDTSDNTDKSSQCSSDQENNSIDNQSKKPKTPVNQESYNLRQRRGIDFSVFR